MEGGEGESTKKHKYSKIILVERGCSRVVIVTVQKEKHDTVLHWHSVEFNIPF